MIDVKKADKVRLVRDSYDNVYICDTNGTTLFTSIQGDLPHFGISGPTLYCSYGDYYGDEHQQKALHVYISNKYTMVCQQS